MTIKQTLINQFGKPSGKLGRVVGWLMAVSNKQLSQWTIEKVKPRYFDRILEVGYGPGVTMEKIADKLITGSIVGIDHSKVMYHMAKRRTRKYSRNKKVMVQCGTIDDLDYPESHFHTIYGNNVHFFWNDPIVELSKLRSYLDSGGKLMMIFQPRWAKSNEEIIEIADQGKEQFKQAGFSKIDVEFKSMKPVSAILITGYKSDRKTA